MGKWIDKDIAEMVPADLTGSFISLLFLKSASSSTTSQLSGLSGVCLFVLLCLLFCGVLLVYFFSQTIDPVEILRKRWQIKSFHCQAELEGKFLMRWKGKGCLQVSWTAVGTLCTGYQNILVHTRIIKVPQGSTGIADKNKK